VRFGILGPLEASGEDGPIPLGGPKQRIVLAHLVLAANQVVSAERLIDALWGDDLPEDPKATLKVYVSRLRSALGSSEIEARSPGYVLRADLDQVDVLRFEGLLREARSDGAEPRQTERVLTEALRLWRGPALSDLNDEPSLSAEIARLEELRLEALEERIDAELELGRHAGVITELESITRSNPLRERLWCELMLALYRSGRQAEALDAFERARTVLADELGIDPSVELRRLHERILRQDPALELEGEPLRGYRLLEEIGEGAFGVVYRATQPQIGREVAIKAVPPEIANHPDFVRRFEREAQIVARLEHPHIVPLYDYWREPDAAYLVMRFLRGGSIQDLLRGGSLAPERAAAILDQIATALSAAHRQGVVHRDIKPGNILLDEEGNAYLTDFGVAFDAGSPEGSSGTMIRGTPGYLSPEQVRLDPASPRSDIYALGIVAYEMFTGALAFDATSFPVPSVSDRRPELPIALDRAIARATAKDPKKRFPDAVEFAAAVRAALRGSAETAPPVGEIRNPYKGLRSFRESDAGDFFGREAVTARLLGRLEEAEPTSRFLAVVGPSGSGKSSVARAGLVPALRRGAVPGSERWYVIDLLPGPHPMRELESALLGLAVEPPSSLLDALESDTRGLLRAVDGILPDPDAELLIVLDQLEEVFTLVVDEDERLHVLESLRAATQEVGSRVRLIATLRADFFDQPLAVRGFGDLLAARTEAVTPMSPEELERAIVAPAERAGLSIEPRLLAAMIADVANHPGGLPLLQFTLTELAERREAGVLTLAGYRRIGGISGALVRRAEQIFGALNEPARAACRQLFLRLVTIGEGSEDTRRRVRRSELRPLAEGRTLEAVLEEFGRHRLLSFDRDPTTREPTVEIAHEALLVGWERLKGWIDDARDDIRTHHKMTSAVAEWEAADRDPSFLLRGSRLDQVRAWAETTTLVLSEGHRAYVDESAAVQRELEERERAMERRSIRRLRSLVALGVAAAMVATILTVVAMRQRERAEEAARIALARELAAAALANLEVDPERSVLLALEAVETTYEVDGTTLRVAEEALHRAVQAQRVVLTLPELNVFDYSPDGGRIIATSIHEANVAWIIDVTTGEHLLVLRGHTKPIQGVDWSTDGRWVATASADGSARVWDPGNGREVLTLHGDAEVPWSSAVFSPDGRRMMTSGDEPFIRLWDLETRRQTQVLRVPSGGRGGVAPGVAWSPDGSHVAAAPIGSYDTFGARYPLMVWNADTGRLLYAPRYQEEEYGGAVVAWSADDRWIVTAGPTIKGWDARSGRRAFTLFPEAEPYALAFSDDGRLLAAGTSDGTTEVWELTPQGPRRFLTLPTSGGWICCLVFSSDGTRLAAGSEGSVEGAGLGKVWDVTPEGGRDWLVLPAVEGGGADVDYSPDGRRLAISLDYQSVSVRDAETGEEVRRVSLPGPSTGIDFSPDGLRLATSGSYGAAVTDIGSGERSLTLRGHEDWVNSVRFSPDGTRLATGSDDGTFRLWDAATGEQLFVLEDVDEFDWGVDFSPDGRLLVTAGAGSVRLWDTGTGRERGTLIETSFVDSAVFAPDGRRVAAGGPDGTVHVWVPGTGREVLTIQGHVGSVTGVAFSPDGRRLATAGNDGLVKIWDAATGEELLTFHDLGTEAWSVAFSPDGRFVAAGGFGTVRVWVLAIEDLMELARERVTRGLTDQECREFLHLDRCPAP